MRFRLKDLIWFMVLIGLCLAIWIEHSRRITFQRTIEQLGPEAWVKIFSPSPTDKYDVHMGTLTVVASAFSPAPAPERSEASVELFLRLDQPPIASVPCQVRETRHLISIHGEIPIPKIEAGSYFIRLKLNDGNRIVHQERAVQFVDGMKFR